MNIFQERLGKTCAGYDILCSPSLWDGEFFTPPLSASLKSAAFWPKMYHMLYILVHLKHTSTDVLWRGSVSAVTVTVLKKASCSRGEKVRLIFYSFLHFSTIFPVYNRDQHHESDFEWRLSKCVHGNSSYWNNKISEDIVLWERA